MEIGWKVIIIWQCQIKNQTLFEQTMFDLIKLITED